MIPNIFLKKMINTSWIFLQPITDMLLASGVKKENIEISSLCTFENNVLLHSYRRDGIHSGRSMGIIALKAADDK